MFDSMEDVGAQPYRNLEVRSGNTFPQQPLVGLLFMHTEHGLCVRSHLNQWRVLSATYEA